MRFGSNLALSALIAFGLLLAAAPSAQAYGTEQCVSDKLRAAAKQCKGVFKAQAKQVKKPNAAKLVKQKKGHFEHSSRIVTSRGC